MFKLDEGLKPGLGTFVRLPPGILIQILLQLPPNSLFVLRFLSRAFRIITSGAYFKWEPTLFDYRKAQTIGFDLGKSRTEGDYYLCSHRGEFRWPAGQLLLCRSDDHGIEVKSLAQGKEGGLSCQYVGELVGHQSKVTVLRPLSGTLIASGDRSGRVFVWRETDKGFDKIELTRSEKHWDEVSAITRTDDEQILTADKRGQLRCWSLFHDRPLWKIKLPAHIVSLKIMQKKQVEVIYLDDEKERYHISIFSVVDGTKLREEENIAYGDTLFKTPLSGFCSFFNGNKVEFRKEEMNLGPGMSRSVNACNLNKRITAPFTPSEDTQEFLDCNFSVFSNGNILFWLNDGNAKLVIHKRLPLTYGKHSLFTVMTKSQRQTPWEFTPHQVAFNNERELPETLEEIDDCDEEKLLY